MLTSPYPIADSHGKNLPRLKMMAARVTLIVVIAQCTSALRATRGVPTMRTTTTHSQSRRAVAGALGGVVALVGLTPHARANGIGGNDGNVLGLRLSDKLSTSMTGADRAALADSGDAEVLDAPGVAALADSAVAFAALAVGVRDADGDGGISVQRFFVTGGWAAMRANVVGLTQNAKVTKALRKSGAAFVQATDQFIESFNVGAFDKAAAQFEFALQLLEGLLARVGLDALPAQPVTALDAAPPTQPAN